MIVCLHICFLNCFVKRKNSEYRSEPGLAIRAAVSAVSTAASPQAPRSARPCSSPPACCSLLSFDFSQLTHQRLYPRLEARLERLQQRVESSLETVLTLHVTHPSPPSLLRPTCIETFRTLINSTHELRKETTRDRVRRQWRVARLSRRKSLSDISANLL